MRETEIGVVVPPGEDNAFHVGTRMTGTLGDLPLTHKPLLEGAITATLATLGARGIIQLSPVWVGSTDTHLEVNTVKGRIKDLNMRARPDVSLMFTNPENAYHWMAIQGVCEEFIDETDPERGHLATESIDSLGQLYLNQFPYPFRDPKGEVRVLIRVFPVRIQVFGSA